MIDKIGNLSYDRALGLVLPYGYTRYLGARYSWEDYEKSGREENGLPPKKYKGGKNHNGQDLPNNVWYDEEQDIMFVTISEDYGLGQSSTIFFLREMSPEEIIQREG